MKNLFFVAWTIASSALAGNSAQVSLGFNAISDYYHYNRSGLSCALGPEGYACWITDPLIPDLSKFKLGPQDPLTGVWSEKFAGPPIEVMDKLILSSDGTGRVYDVRPEGKNLDVSFHYWTRTDVEPRQLVIKANSDRNSTWPMVWWFGSGWESYGAAGLATDDYLRCIYRLESGKLLMRCLFPNSLEFPKEFDHQYYFAG